MLLECIANRIEDLPEIDRQHVRQNVHADKVQLTLNRQYVVYGIVMRAGFPWYLICEANDSAYPTPHYAGFFRVVDNKIPRGWSYQWRNGAWPDGALIPTEWCKPRFFEALLDGLTDETALFKSTKADVDAVSL
jgi:hypothetical protein